MAAWRWVVGNSTYAHIGRLPNPVNDARDMSAVLRRIGFAVTIELNASRVELTEALRAVTRQSAGGGVSLVFYAGHGIEMDSVNYLVPVDPVDARLERDVDVRFETVTVDDLLVSTSGASLRLLILDACRNNPLSRSVQRTAASRSVSGGSFADLNEDLLGDETLVAYAAAAGMTAADGRGRTARTRRRCCRTWRRRWRRFKWTPTALFGSIGFRFTDVWKNVDEDSARRVHGPKRRLSCGAEPNA